MKKYPFDSRGVTQWLAELYSATITYQMMEQEHIQLSLRSWLISRFHLTKDQITYITTLSEDFKGNLAREIVFAINNHSPIILDKQTDEQRIGKLAPDSVKVTEYESKKKQADVSHVPSIRDVGKQFNRNMDGQLMIRIYYKPL
jgi:hypothetical protein